jgi:two-component system phosphate regulon sensor histidine kinase PhoR
VSLGIRRRVLAVSSTLVILGVTGAGVWLTADVRDGLEATMDAGLVADARGLAHVLGAKNVEPDDVGRWASLLDGRVIVAGVDGRIRLDSGGLPAGTPVTQVPGAYESFDSEHPEAHALAQPAGGPARGAIAGLSGPEGGYVLVIRSDSAVDAAVRRMGWQMAFAGLCALAAAAFVAWIAARVVSRTLTDLIKGVQAVAQGHRGVRLSPGDAEEFGGLAGSINQLAESLEGTVATLAAERSRFETMLERLSDAVLALDDDDRITMVNRGALRLFGFERAPIGRTLLETVRLPVLAELVRRARTEGRVKAEVDWTSGRRRRLLARATRLGDGGGTVLVIQDLTALRRLETMRRDFVANVSHELRTPVGVILANAETLLDGALEDPHAARGFAEALHRNAQRLASLLDDLLDISRLEAGQSHLKPERLDLSESVDLAVDSVLSKAERKEIRVLREIPPETWIRADAKGLEQVIVNLIDNALKYVPEGSTVRVFTVPTDDESRVRINVEDDGPGIDAQHRERIFERFYRIDPGRSRDMGGTGLGLSIVRHLVENMGGQVGVEPVTPRGARFWFTVPRFRD